MTSGSWIIVSKATGRAVLETFSQAVADAVNREKYEVWSAYEYLVDLNKRIKAKGESDVS